MWWAKVDGCVRQQYFILPHVGDWFVNCGSAEDTNKENMNKNETTGYTIKTKQLVLWTYFVLALCIFRATDTYSQDSYIKHRWNIKAGYARYNNRYGFFHNETTGNYRIETNFGVLNYIETGAYIGYSKFEYLQETLADSINSGGYTTEGNNTFFYGVNFNFHLLPFFIKKDDFRFDAYLTGKLGGLYFSKDHIHKTEYAVGGGLCFYPLSHIGIYTEYCYGNYIYGYVSNSNVHTKFRYGLTLKF